MLHPLISVWTEAKAAPSCFAASIEELPTRRTRSYLRHLPSALSMAPLKVTAHRTGPVWGPALNTERPG